MAMTDQIVYYLDGLVVGNDNLWIETSLGWVFARVLRGGPPGCLKRYHEYDTFDYLAASTDDSAYSIVYRTVGSIGYDVFEIDSPYDGLPQIWQILMAINDPNLKLWITYPGTQTRGSINGNIPNPAIGDPYGWWMEGKDSPIEWPTNYGEIFLLPGKNMAPQFAFSNDNLYGIQPVIDFYINQMVVYPYDPRTEAGQAKIRGILKGQIPAKRWQFDKAPINYPDFENVFKVPPVQWDGVTAIWTSKQNGVEQGEIPMEGNGTTIIPRPERPAQRSRTPVRDAFGLEGVRR